MSRKGCWEKKTTLSEVPSSVPLFPGNFIHGAHGEHGFSLKIILKIFVKISSRRRSIIKSFPEARYSSAFSVEIFLKILFAASLNYRLFLAIGHILLKISTKDFLRSNPPKNPRSTRRTRILVKDSSKDFVLCCLSARNLRANLW